MLQMNPFMRINGSVCAYLRTYRSIHGCFFHTTPFSHRHDSCNRTAHDSGHIAVSGIQSGIHFLPANSVPAALPATISQSASGRAPLVMMVSIPAPSPAGPPAISSSSRPDCAASRHPPPSHTRHRRCIRSGKAAALRDADADRCHTTHRYRKKSPAGSPCARKNRSARRPDISALPHLKQAAGIARHHGKTLPVAVMEKTVSPPAKRATGIQTHRKDYSV